MWEVTPGVFAPPITYVLSCKWGLVNKEHVDDFLEVLRWSKEFGVDTPDGRRIKQGVYGVFAGGGETAIEEWEQNNPHGLPGTPRSATRQRSSRHHQT